MVDPKRTKKAVYEIADMLGCSNYSTCSYPYLQSIISPTCTHVLNMVSESMLDHWKDKIKKIGGKKLKVAKAHTAPYKVIYFFLGMTPQEETQEKLRQEEAERKKQAYESRLTDIKLSPMCIAVHATNERGQENFARMLIDGSLDPLLPFESYVVMEPPRDKDEKRIVDIVNKSNCCYDDCVGMLTKQNCIACMRELARRMNNAITDEAKRERRRAACLHYGLKFLAECFTKTAQRFHLLVEMVDKETKRSGFPQTSFVVSSNSLMFSLDAAGDIRMIQMIDATLDACNVSCSLKQQPCIFMGLMYQLVCLQWALV